MKIEDSDLNKKGDIFGIHKTNSVYRKKYIKNRPQTMLKDISFSFSTNNILFGLFA